MAQHHFIIDLLKAYYSFVPTQGRENEEKISIAFVMNALLCSLQAIVQQIAKNRQKKARPNYSTVLQKDDGCL